MTQTTGTVCELCGEAPGPYCADKLCRTCDECGAGPGEPCGPMCTAPYGPGGPLEHEDDYGSQADAQSEKIPDGG